MHGVVSFRATSHGSWRDSVSLQSTLTGCSSEVSETPRRLLRVCVGLLCLDISGLSQKVKINVVKGITRKYTHTLIYSNDGSDQLRSFGSLDWRVTREYGTFAYDGDINIQYFTVL